MKNMWEPILSRFDKYPSRLKVIKIMLEFGFNISQDRNEHSEEKVIFFAGPVELSITKLARACGVDRKVVEATALTIINDARLYTVFSKLKPIADISDVARYNKESYDGVLEIHALPSAIGIAALASRLLVEENITIRYMVARDADLSVLYVLK